MSGLRWAKTWEEFCEQVIGHPVGGFESIRRGAILLRAEGVAEPTQSEARAAGLNKPGHRGPNRNVVDELRRNSNKVTANALHSVGNKGGNTTLNDDSAVGRGAGYFLSRLRRAAPEILTRFQAGEFRSVRAAAIEVGIVKPDTPLTLLMRAWRRASPQERGKVPAVG